MAGDWIKIEHITPDKPEIIGMAATLGCDPDAVVGKLFRIWIWADQNSVDGNGMSVTDAFLDRLTHRKGFARAMRDCGWLQGDSGALVFPGFERHNGRTAKARAESNRRMAKSRAGCGNVAAKAQQKAQPEKRREEKKNTTCSNPLPPVGGGEAFLPGEFLDVPGIVAIYPRKERVAEACLLVAKAINDGTPAEAIATGTRAFAAVIAQLPGGHLNKFVPGAAGFFRDRRWEDDPQTMLRQAGAGGGPAVPLELGGRKGTTIKISA